MRTGSTSFGASPSHGEYESARCDTDEYLEVLEEQRFKAYFWALHHWEQCLGATWHALKTLHLMSGIPPFTKADAPDTNEQKVNELYNASNTEGGIRDGDMPPDGPHRVWLSKEGIRSQTVVLPYDNLAALLTDLGDLFAFAFEDPMTLSERAAEAYAAFADRQA